MTATPDAGVVNDYLILQYANFIFGLRAPAAVGKWIVVPDEALILGPNKVELDCSRQWTLPYLGDRPRPW